MFLRVTLDSPDGALRNIDIDPQTRQIIGIWPSVESAAQLADGDHYVLSAQVDALADDMAARRGLRYFAPVGGDVLETRWRIGGYMIIMNDLGEP